MDVQKKAAEVKRTLAAVAADMAKYLADRPGWDGPERVEFERIRAGVEQLSR